MPRGQAAAELVASALTGNPIFKRLSEKVARPAAAGTIGGSRSSGAGESLPAVEFAPVVVQYFQGDPTEANGLTSEVARDACAGLLGLSPEAEYGGRGAPSSSATGLLASTAKMGA
jgi:hypothetical protein